MFNNILSQVRLTRSVTSRYFFPLLILISLFILQNAENRVAWMVLLQNTLSMLIAYLMYFYLFYFTWIFANRFKKTALVPIVKNKTGDTSDKNNYRPIAIVTDASKLFEICILKVLDAYLITHDHQFGFKSKHSTDIIIIIIIYI